MKRKTTLFLLLCLPLLLLSQITFPKNFRFADTAQVHVLTTVRGDQFIGRVNAWRGNTLFFSMGKNSKVKFQVAEVRSVELYAGQALHLPDSPSRGIFTLVTHDSIWVYEGLPFRLNDKWVKFKTLEEGSLRFRTEDVRTISFSTDFEAGYPNVYKLLFDWKPPHHGRLLAYQNGEVLFWENEETKAYPLDKIYGLKLQKPRAEMRGHQHTVLFSPTGFNLNRGETQVRNTMLAQNSVAHGLIDQVSFGGGLTGISPFLHVRTSYGIHRLLHFSAGVMWHPSPDADGLGAHVAASLGTPDYFINFARMKNAGEIRGKQVNARANCFAASMRVGRRKRLFVEYIFIEEDPLSYFGAYSNQQQIFSWGMGVFNSDASFTFGLTTRGPIVDDYRFYPAFSGEFLIGKRKGS